MTIQASQHGTSTTLTNNVSFISYLGKVTLRMSPILRWGWFSRYPLTAVLSIVVVVTLNSDVYPLYGQIPHNVTGVSLSSLVCVAREPFAHIARE